MKAFVLGLLFSVGLAVAAGFILESYFSRTADDAFSMSSARVGEGGSVEQRNFSGSDPDPGRNR